MKSRLFELMPPWNSIQVKRVYLIRYNSDYLIICVLTKIQTDNRLLYFISERTSLGCNSNDPQYDRTKMSQKEYAGLPPGSTASEKRMAKYKEERRRQVILYYLDLQYTLAVWIKGAICLNIYIDRFWMRYVFLNQWKIVRMYL